MKIKCRIDEAINDLQALKELSTEENFAIGSPSDYTFWQHNFIKTIVNQSEILAHEIRKQQEAA